MKRIYVSLTLVMSLCIGLIGSGIVTAQEPPVILAENYSSAPDRVVFFYPTGWVVDKQSSFVSVSDTKTTIEFYTASLSQGVINLSNNNLEASVLSFLNILGAEEIGTVIPANQATQVTIKEETFIGTSIVNAGQLQYVFLVKGLLMDEPGLIFIRVKGPALDLLASPDAFLTIIKSFGTFATPDGVSTTAPTTTDTTVTNPDSGKPNSPVIKEPEIVAAALVPCTVQAIDANSELRVGPGKNRSIILYLSPTDTYEVIGTANDSEGLRWWRLDKTKAAPKKAAQVNETWVSDAHMIETGDCEAVGTVAAPRIIRIQPTAASTTIPVVNATAQPTPIEGSTEPFVSFSGSQSGFSGECTLLTWDVRNIKEIYLIDGDGFEKGVTGPTGSEEVCPPSGLGFNFLIYTLRAVPQSGNDIFKEVVVPIVSTTPQCLIPYPGLSEFGMMSFTDLDSYTLYVDTTCGGSFNTPATVFIDAVANDSNMDPYIEVYLDGQFFGNNDDSFGSLDSFLQFEINAPTTIRVDVSNLRDGPGAYTLSIFVQAAN